MSAWDRLVHGLVRADTAPPTAAGGERQAAVLVLLSAVTGAGGPGVELVYIRRCDRLQHHPGQIAFPGGRVDDGETVEGAALREAAEEVALDRGTAEVLGRLPAVFVPPSAFWIQPVVARWHTPHALRPAEGEVTEILRVRHAALTEPAGWRVVRLPDREAGWAWRLDETHLLWGATAAVTATLLDLLEPGWRGDLRADDLESAREVDRPHEPQRR